MPEPRENPRVEVNEPVRDLFALIRADRSFLYAIEHDVELNQRDTTVIELKRIIIHRIAGFQKELHAEVGSTEGELQIRCNCLFASE